MKIQFPKLPNGGLSDEEQDFYDDLIDLNDWLRRQYGPKGFSCEDVRLAYNFLVMEELRKDDGRVVEAYPKLDPKHVGEVLAAYKRRVDLDGEVNRVISQALYLPEPEQPDQEQIDAQIDASMQRMFEEAVEWTKNGANYIDHGNGLYTWLYQKGIYRHTDDEWELAVDEAISRVRVGLANQKAVAGSIEGYEHLRVLIGKRLGAVLQEEGDYVKRVQNEVMRILLANYLKRCAGEIIERPKPLPKTPDISSTAPEFKPFVHSAYIDNLKEQLPTMDDKAVASLLTQARQRNVLDVFELATAETDRRKAQRATVSKSAKAK